MGGPNGLKGQLTTAIDLLTGSFVHPALIGAGPFTLFLMVDSAFANLTQEEVKVVLLSLANENDNGNGNVFIYCTYHSLQTVYNSSVG